MVCGCLASKTASRADTVYSSSISIDMTVYRIV